MTDYQNELVMEHLDLVNWVIRTRISVPNRPLLTYDDFYAIGCEAICRAALKYQADSGEFAPFACRYIYNAIIDHCRAMNYRLQRSVDAGFEEGEVLFDLLAHTTVDFEAEVTDDSATFDYVKQPSKAMLKYRKAFLRNDGDRYTAFMDRVAEEAEQIHAGTLTPYEIITPFFKRNIRTEERKAIDVTWNAQEDFTDGENALVVIDGSGSMYGGPDPIPATVALSLGIYYAERNTGAFHNHFITFSENPRLVEIKSKDIFEKVRYCHQFNEVANTNIQRVFELVLKAAVKNHVPQEEMPAKIFIISDMEFDYCTEDCSLTNFEYAQKLFLEHGYRLPDLVFWNVDSRNRQQPVRVNDQGVALVSGCNARIFSLLKSGILSPYAVMMDVLGSERYAAIVA